MKKRFGFLTVALAGVLLLSSCALGDISGSSNGGIQNSGGSSGGLNDDIQNSGGGSSGGGNTDCVHKDTDSNDLCDSCNQTVCYTVDFYAVNDLHGKFTDSGNQPGVDEMTTYFKSAAQNNPYTVFLASGDLWQGGSASNLTKGKIVTEWMNEVGFSAMTLGNHEYDWGEEFIEENAALAEFPMLALNIFDRDTNERVSYCDASVTVEFGDLTIGIIGAIGDCYSSISSEYTTGVYFKTGKELTDLVKAESSRLREAGADFIVYSLHDDDSGYDVGLSSGGFVDLVFEGHTHQSYVKQDSAGVYHLQGGGDNKGLSHATAKINFAGGRCRVTTANFLSKSAYENLADDPCVADLLKKYENEISIADMVVGYNASYRSSGTILQLVSQLYLQAGLEKWGNYDIVLGGGFLNVRSPYNLQKGQIKYSDLLSILPFDNEIVLCSVSGYYLRKKFTETTNDDYYITYSEYGGTVRTKIDNNKTYYVVVDSYTSQYAPNNLTEIARYGAGVYARDLLADYIAKGNWA